MIGVHNRSLLTHFTLHKLRCDLVAYRVLHSNRKLPFHGGGEPPGDSFFTPKSHDTQTHVGRHTFWDPGGGIRSFPNHNKPLPIRTVLGATGSVGATDEDQLIESNGTVGLNKKTNDTEEGPSITDQTDEELVYEGSSTPASGNKEQSSKINKVHMAIGPQGAANEDVMSLTNCKEVVLPDGGVGVLPEKMSLPVTGDLGLYELGLRPTDCSETREQLNRAEYVPGMLPFQK